MLFQHWRQWMTGFFCFSALASMECCVLKMRNVLRYQNCKFFLSLICILWKLSSQLWSLISKKNGARTLNICIVTSVPITASVCYVPILVSPYPYSKESQRPKDHCMSTVQKKWLQQQRHVLFVSKKLRVVLVQQTTQNWSFKTHHNSQVGQPKDKRAPFV